MKLMIVESLAVLLLATTGYADTRHPATAHEQGRARYGNERQRASELSEGDRHFATEAAKAGKAEVELGRIAKERGQSQEVRDFGSKMVEDHGQANEKLTSIATSKNLDLPSEETQALTSDLKKFRALPQSQFDKEYWKKMVKDHEEAVNLFEKESKSAKDSELRRFAADTLPTLKSHLEMAKRYEAR